MTTLAKPIVTSAILTQILDVRATSLVNMFDAPGVKHLADDMRCYDLVRYISERRTDYARGIMLGFDVTCANCFKPFEWHPVRIEDRPPMICESCDLLSHVATPADLVEVV